MVRLGEAVPGDTLRAFRRGFGALMALAAVRFVANDWVEEQYLAPAVHFPWVSWAVVPSASVLYGLFAVMAVGAGVAAFARRGWRLGLAAWWLAFVYVELLDKTWYLNHYVLVTILGATLIVAPEETGDEGRPWTRTWAWWLLRAEIASVYVWAGLCKVQPDWLLDAQPLRTWLAAKAGVPLVGPWLASAPVAYGMAWGGMLYDLAIPWLLLWPRTRRLGFALVLGFHLVTAALFPIGVFPWVMLLASTLFLAPDAAAWGRAPGDPPAWRPPTWPGRVAWWAAVLALWLVPARFLLWGGPLDVLWTERGFRFAWRVLLIEKTGMVSFVVTDRATGETWRVEPSAHLTPTQAAQMRTQPDLIRDHARFLGRVHGAPERDLSVVAEGWVSLHGRPAQRLIDPTVDLLQPNAHLEAQGWIVPLGQQLRPAPPTSRGMR